MATLLETTRRILPSSDDPTMLDHSSPVNSKKELEYEDDEEEEIRSAQQHHQENEIAQNIIVPMQGNKSENESSDEVNADTLTASNISNLHKQLYPSGQQRSTVNKRDTSAVSADANGLTNATEASDTHLSLRDLFSHSEEEEGGISEKFERPNEFGDEEDDEELNPQTSKEELWDYDEALMGGESSVEQSSTNHALSKSNLCTTPPDSLHSRKRLQDSSASSIVVYHQREGPQTFGRLPQPQVATTQRQDSDTTYSSDSSTGNTGDSSFRQRSFSPSQPMLYSAIGSLEDPSNSSFNWKQRRNQVKKYELSHASNMMLLAPLSKQGSNNNNNATTATTPGGAITVIEPQPRKLESSSVIVPKVISNDNGENEANDPASHPPKHNAQQQEEKSNKKPSSLRKKQDENTVGDNGGTGSTKKVKIANNAQKSSGSKSTKTLKRKSKKQVEMFRPSSDAYTPRMGKKEIKYKPAEMRTPVQDMASGLGTLSRPNFRDALRRVAMIIHQHIVKIERRFETMSSGGFEKGGGKKTTDKLFMRSMKDEFSDDQYITPTYKCTMVRVPMARAGMVMGLKQVRPVYEIPTEREIYEFAHRLFKTVQLSSECSIVCLIYVERLMEEGKVPLLASTWRPIMMTGLLLASKVWQDLSSWNIEFTNVYPQYSLEAIHRLEVKFLRILKWDLYISSSLYAKYFFALRSLVEKQDFRQRYNRMVGGVNNVQVQDALKVEERSSRIKEEALLQLSRSM